MNLILFSGIAVAKSPYGEMDLYFNDRLLPGSEVAKPTLKIDEPFSVRVDVTLYQESKLYIELTVIDKTHFEFIDGPADIDRLTSHVFETNETHTFEWTLKPTDAWAGGTIPINIHYTIFMIDEYEPSVYSGFTIAYPYISNEYYYDKTPPFISDIIINDLINDSAIISWDTNKDSNSVVRYGTTSGDYKNVEYDTALVSSHSISLSGLSAQTTYYFVVNSTDASGNANESSEYNFTTATIPTTTLPVVLVEDVTAAPDSYAFTSIMVNNVTDLGSGKVSVTFDPLVVHVTTVTSGDGNALVVQDWNVNNTAGSLEITAWDVYESYNGDVVFAHVTLYARGEYPDSTSLVISSSELTNYTSYDSIGHSITNGTFSVSDSEPPVITDAIATPDVILNDNGRSRAPGTNVTVLNTTVIDSGSGVMNVTIDLSSIGGSDVRVMERMDDTDIWTVTTNAIDGINLTHELVVTATDEANNTNTSVIGLTVFLRGDVVRDSNLNSADVLYIAKYLVGKESMPSLFVGDISPDIGDEIITSADALYLAKYLVGKEAAP